jgi:hypothetical protein
MALSSAMLVAMPLATGSATVHNVTSLSVSAWKIPRLAELADAAAQQAPARVDRRAAPRVAALAVRWSINEGQ